LTLTRQTCITFLSYSPTTTLILSLPKKIVMHYICLNHGSIVKASMLRALPLWNPHIKDKNGFSILNTFIVMQSYIIFNYKSKSPHCKGGCARNLWLNSPFKLILMQMATCSASNKSKYLWVWF
jgi:hypothetical protein